jgi:hypothetical protein
MTYSKVFIIKKLRLHFLYEKIIPFIDDKLHSFINNHSIIVVV